jgi:hypothetical protein
MQWKPVRQKYVTVVTIDYEKSYRRVGAWQMVMS